MELKISVKEISSALKKCSVYAIPNNNILKSDFIEEQIILCPIENDEKNIYVIAHNPSDGFVLTVAECESLSLSKDEIFAVDYSGFSSFIRNVNVEDIELNVDRENNILIANSNHSKFNYKFNMVDLCADKVKKIKENIKLCENFMLDDYGCKISVDKIGDLIKKFQNILNFKSILKLPKFDFDGPFFDFSEKINIMTTDGNKMTLIDFGLNDSGHMYNQIIPYKILKMFPVLFDKEFFISNKDNIFFLSDKKTCLFFYQYECDMPNYKTIIPEDNECSVDVIVENYIFSKSLERLNICLKKDKNKSLYIEAKGQNIYLRIFESVPFYNENNKVEENKILIGCEEIEVEPEIIESTVVVPVNLQSLMLYFHGRDSGKSKIKFYVEKHTILIHPINDFSLFYMMAINND